MANGLLPGTAFLVILFAGTVVVSVPFLTRPASRLRMLILMVGGQTFIHLCLTLTAGHVGDPKPAPTPAAPGHRDGQPAGGRRAPGRFVPGRVRRDQRAARDRRRPCRSTT